MGNRKGVKWMNKCKFGCIPVLEYLFVLPSHVNSFQLLFSTVGA